MTANVQPEPGSARSPVARAAAFERGIYPALWRWLRRAPDLGGDPAHTTAHAYAGIVAATIWVWIAVSALEMVVVHFLIPWDVVRWVVLLLSVWGLIWMLGMLGSLTIHPHLVTPSAVRVRNGHTIDLTIPHERIVDITAGVRSAANSRTVQSTPDTLQVAMSGQVNVHLRLADDVPLQLPGGRYVVRAVSLWADDPRAMVVALRQAGART